MSVKELPQAPASKAIQTTCVFCARKFLLDVSTPLNPRMIRNWTCSFLCAALESGRRERAAASVTQ